MLTDFDIICPYCGEIFNTLVDYSPLIDSDASEDYTYVEDCQICCQPILLTPVIDQDGQLQNVIARQENE